MKKLILFMVLILVPVTARAIPIIPENLDNVTLGVQVANDLTPFNVAAPPPNIMGALASSVWFDGLTYTYVSNVLPILNDNSHLNTAFSPNNFTGEMGWSFSDALSAGGDGDALDFLTAQVNGRLHWLGLERGIGANWDAGDTIQFYFRSTAPPTIGDYNLLNSEASTAQGFAPIPEPGTLALFGSGLYGLYKVRKRKKQNQALA